jgi:hypothetical protein
VGSPALSNSLIGSWSGDAVSQDGIVPLANARYVVKSSHWKAGRGAATWRDGSGGVGEEISASNSLVGSSMGDHVGATVTALASGHFVVASDAWSDVGLPGVGAVTWADADGSVTGAVSAAQSLVGATPGDRIGLGGVLPLPDGNYLVRSPLWDAAAHVDAGAITLLRGDGAVTGPVSAANSVVGDVPGEGGSLPLDYDAVAHRLVVGRPASNIVSVYRDDGLFLAGFETL